MGVRTGLIVFRHPSGISGPRVAGTQDCRVRRRSTCKMLRVAFEGIITAKLVKTPWGKILRRGEGSIAGGTNLQT